MVVLTASLLLLAACTSGSDRAADSDSAGEKASAADEGASRACIVEPSHVWVEEGEAASAVVDCGAADLRVEGPDGIEVAGDELSWFDVGDCRVGLACCFDLRFKEMAAMLVDAPPHGLGCDVVLYPSAWLQSTGALGHWETLLTARALDGQCYVVAPNAATVTDAETVAFGRTMIARPALPYIVALRQ